MRTTESPVQPYGGRAGKWTTRYEHLRRQVLEEPTGRSWSRSLLVVQGVLGWIEAWPPDHDCEPSIDTPVPQSAAETPPLPSGLYQKMTRVFVDIIFASKEVGT
jgi:hypothetical protein